MAKDIQVTPDMLDQAAVRIDGLSEDYKRLYEQMYSETSAMASSWDGADNVAFVNQIDGFKDDLAKMHDLMNAYAEFLRKSAKAYRDTQNAVIQEAKKLAN